MLNFYFRCVRAYISRRSREERYILHGLLYAYSRSRLSVKEDSDYSLSNHYKAFGCVGGLPHEDSMD